MIHLSELAPLWCEGEHPSIHAGAVMRHALGNESTDVQKLDAALKAEFSVARMKSADEADFVVCGVDHG